MAVRAHHNIGFAFVEEEFPRDCAARFTPVRLVGAGGFARVWLAKQVGGGREVAVKVLTPEALADEDAVARFATEARLSATLAHPGVVALVDHGAAEGVPWIAYEYVSGPDLAERVRGGALAWSEVRAVGQQVAEALAAAHALGIIHRDIKPANVLQTAPLKYKLADFGLARAAGAAPFTAAGVVVGTAAYMAPELVRGEPPTPASDLYALGATLFELATGAPPFPRDTPLATIEAHLKEPVPRPAGIPREAQALLTRLLAKSPADRPHSAAALVRELALAPALTSTSATRAVERPISFTASINVNPSRNAKLPLWQRAAALLLFLLLCDAALLAARTAYRTLTTSTSTSTSKGSK